MKRENERKPLELIELGAVSAETKGDAAPHWEAVGQQRNVGISDD